MTVASLLGLLAQPAFGQLDSNLIERLQGHALLHSNADWQPLHKLIVASFPESKQFTACQGSYYVWRIRSEVVVFQPTSPGSTDGESFAGFYWFDLNSTPISSTAFPAGQRMYFRKCALTSIPGVSSYVIEATMSPAVGRPIQVDFGFVGYKPLLIHYGEKDGTLLQNSYDNPSFACGPKPPAYTKAELLDALSGSNPLLQLQSLIWLAGRHSLLSADIVDVPHEPITDSVHYWSVSSDSSVAQAAAALVNSPIEWVSNAAKLYVSVAKPQSVPAMTFTPRLKSVATNDIRIGKGGDFDRKDRVVKPGDRVVLQYEITISTGVTIFSNLNKPENPPIFQVGSNQVIDGLSLGLIGMKAGGVRTIEIPAAQAYGDAGADVVPPGADLTYKVRLLHIATEGRFGAGGERILLVKERKVGTGPQVTPGDTVNVNCKVYRLDGHQMNIPEFTGNRQIVLFTGSLLKRAILGMKVGGERLLLVNSPDVFGQDQTWFHYGPKVLEVRLDSVMPKPAPPGTLAGK